MQVSAGSIANKHQIQGLVMGLGVLGVIWELASWIIAGRDQTLLLFGLSFVICGLVVYILNVWLVRGRFLLSVASIRRHY